LGSWTEIKSCRVAVVIPALNEAEAIGKVLSDIPPGVADEVIVVNNDSTDETPAIARRAGATVLDETRRGYGSACLKAVGYLSSKRNRPDVVVFLDGDYSDHPEEMIGLIEPLANGSCDFSIGSRIRGQLERGSMPWQQVFGNRLATILIRLFYGAKFTDLGPFRAIRLKELLALDMRELTYGWPIEMQLKAVKRKMRICEVPVSYRARIGRSKISGTLTGTLLAGYMIISSVFKNLW
jgi:glycosyltransferase involved in cell wall biosynthesis